MNIPIPINQEVRRTEESCTVADQDDKLSPTDVTANVTTANTVTANTVTTTTTNAVTANVTTANPVTASTANPVTASTANPVTASTAVTTNVATANTVTTNVATANAVTTNIATANAVTANALFYKCGFCEQILETKELFTQHIKDKHMLHIFCCKQKEVNFFNHPPHENEMRSAETPTPSRRTDDSKAAHKNEVRSAETPNPSRRTDDSKANDNSSCAKVQQTNASVQAQRSLLKCKNISIPSELTISIAEKAPCLIKSTSPTTTHNNPCSDVDIETEICEIFSAAGNSESISTLSKADAKEEVTISIVPKVATISLGNPISIVPKVATISLGNPINSISTTQTTSQKNPISVLEKTSNTRQEIPISDLARNTTIRQENPINISSTIQTKQENSINISSTTQTKQENSINISSTTQTKQENSINISSTTQTRQENSITISSTTQTRQENSIDILAKIPAVTQENLFYVSSKMPTIRQPNPLSILAKTPTVRQENPLSILAKTPAISILAKTPAFTQESLLNTTSKDNAREKIVTIRKENLNDIVQIHSFVGAYQVVGSTSPASKFLAGEGSQIQAQEAIPQQELLDDTAHELDIVPSCFFKIPDHAYYSKTIFNMPDELLATYFKKKRTRPRKQKFRYNAPEQHLQPTIETEDNSELNAPPEKITKKITKQPVKVVPVLSAEVPSRTKKGRRRRRKPKKLFACDYCEASFYLRQMLVRHVNEKHSYQLQPISCAKCDLRFSSMCKMQNHIKSRSHYIGWFCYPCVKRFYKLEDFWKHGCRFKHSKSFDYIEMRKFYSKEREIWQCNVCKELFFAENVLKSHISKCCLLCDRCDLAFYEAMAYINHKNRCKTLSLEDESADNSPDETGGDDECLIHCKYCTQSFTPNEIDTFLTHVDTCPRRKSTEKRSPASPKIKKKRGRPRAISTVQRNMSRFDSSEFLVDEAENGNLAGQFEMNLDCAEFVEEEFRADTRNKDPFSNFFQTLNLQPPKHRRHSTLRHRTPTKAKKSINVRDKLVLSPALQPSCEIQKLHVTGSGGSSKLAKSPKSPAPQFMIVDVRTCAEFFGNENDTLQATPNDDVNFQLSKSAPRGARRNIFPDDASRQMSTELYASGKAQSSVKELTPAATALVIKSGPSSTVTSASQPTPVPAPVVKSAGPFSTVTSTSLKPAAVVPPVRKSVRKARKTEYGILAAIPAKPTKVLLNSQRMILITKFGKRINCYFRYQSNYVSCGRCGHWIKKKRIKKHYCFWIRSQLSNCSVMLTDINEVGKNVGRSRQKEVSPEMQIIQNISKVYSTSEAETRDKNQPISISKEIHAGAAYSRLVSLRRHVRKSYAELPEVIDQIEAQLPENFTYTYVDEAPAKVNNVFESKVKTHSRSKFAEWKKKWALKRPKTKRRHAVKQKAIETANLKFALLEDDKIGGKEVSFKTSEVASSDYQENENVIEEPQVVVPKEDNSVNLKVVADKSLKSDAKQSSSFCQRSLFSDIGHHLIRGNQKPFEDKEKNVTVVVFENASQPEKQVQMEEMITNDTAQSEVSEVSKKNELAKKLMAGSKSNKPAKKMLEVSKQNESAKKMMEILKQRDPAEKVITKQTDNVAVSGGNTTNLDSPNVSRKDYTRKRKLSLQQAENDTQKGKLRLPLPNDDTQNRNLSLPLLIDDIEKQKLCLPQLFDVTGKRKLCLPTQVLDVTRKSKHPPKDYTRKQKLISAVEVGREHKKETSPVAKKSKQNEPPLEGEKEKVAVSVGNFRTLRRKKRIFYYGKQASEQENSESEQNTSTPDENQQKQISPAIPKRVAIADRPIATVKPMSTRSHLSPVSAKETHDSTSTVNQETRKRKTSEKDAPTTPLNKISQRFKENYECYVCASQFDNNKSFRNHTRTHAKTHPFVCNMCGNCFDTLVALTTHIHNAGKLPVRSCDACAFQFCTKKQVDKHMKFHKSK
uniref:C2H2-type domain-containing protein n=1 Tax=Strigamia maritima TaxID=126957 RepID=T1JA66_STRMM